MNSAVVDEEASGPARWKVIGSGLVVAATGVGAADMVATLVAGSQFGHGLLWAIIAAPNVPDMLKGLVPIIPEGGVIHTLALAGGVGGTITLAAYGYWPREKGWHTPKWMLFIILGIHSSTRLSSRCGAVERSSETHGLLRPMRDSGVLLPPGRMSEGVWPSSLVCARLDVCPAMMR